MAAKPSLSAIFEAVPKLGGSHKIPIKATFSRCQLDNKDDGGPAAAPQASRRVAIGLASIALLGNATIPNAFAEDNGYWVTGPLPLSLPNVTNTTGVFQP